MPDSPLQTHPQADPADGRAARPRLVPDLDVTFEDEVDRKAARDVMETVDRGMRDDDNA